MTAKLKGEHELRADAVGAGDENRVAEVTAYFEKGAEAADRSEHAGDQRAFGSGLDAFNEFIASVD